MPPEGGKHAKESLVTFRAPTSGGRKGTMRIVHQRCCALDVHKKSITACVLVWDGEQAVEERKKQFGTTKKELERLERDFVSAFPDAAYVVEELLADGDRVVLRATTRGTQRGEFEGIAPTNRRVEFTAIVIYRIHDGLIAESWGEVDLLRLMRQLRGTENA